MAGDILLKCTLLLVKLSTGQVSVCSHNNSHTVYKVDLGCVEGRFTLELNTASHT